MSRFLAGLAILVPFLVAAGPRHQELLSLLPEGRDLLPADALAEARFHAQDGHGSGGIVAGPAAQGQPTTFRVAVERVPEHHYRIAMSWSATGPVAEGEPLLLLCEARRLGHGQAEVRAVIRRVPKPYMHCLSDIGTVNGDAWQELAFVASPGFSAEARGTHIGFTFGSRVQTLELRNVRLLGFGDAVSTGTLMRLAGSRISAHGRHAVGEPLGPRVLWEMGVFENLPPAPQEGAQTSTWQRTYAIWTCHGYLFRANKLLGLLRLEGHPLEGGRTRLRVLQQIMNDRGGLHRIEVDAICADNALLSPQSWRLTSTMTTPAGDNAPELTTVREAGAPPDGAPGPVTTDWCLFRAVEHLPFAEAPPRELALLEGFTRLKEHHTLRYDGAHDVALGTDTLRLHRFVQTGAGILPYEYWLDDAHRLLMAVTHSRVYIQLPDAEVRFRRHVESQRAACERLRQRYDRE